MRKLLALLLLCPLIAAAAITVDVQVSRSSCTAPCYVNFDATGTRSTTEDTQRKAFRNLHYVWDFADTGAGSYTTGNTFLTSKNAARGGVAGHVFETAGTYVVRLTVYDTTAATATTTTTITVAAQSSVTALTGANVICVSTDGNFSGAPASCTQVTTSNLSTALGNVSSTKKRISFKRAQTWTSTSDQLTVNQSDVVFDSWGSGALPIWSYTGSNTFDWFIGYGGATRTNWVFSDLDVRGGTDAKVFSSTDVATNILFLRVTATTSVGGGIYADEFRSGTGIHSLIAIVDSTLTGSYASYFAAEKAAFLGNTITGIVGVGAWRSQYFTKSVFQHNTVAKSSQGFHLMKWGGPKRGGSGVAPAQYLTLNSEYAIASDNIFDDRTGAGGWAIGVGAENAQEDERVLDTIFERNWHRANTSTEALIIIFGGQWILVRNSLLDLSGTTSTNDNIEGVKIDRRGVEPIPTDNAVINNTIYRSNTHTGGNAQNGVRIATGTNAVVKNNIAYTPNASGAVFLFDAGTGTTTATNSDNTQMRGTPNPGPTWSSPANPVDFKLNSGSSVFAGSGTDGLNVYDDYFGSYRKFHTSLDTDVGFHALNTGALPAALRYLPFRTP